MLQDQMMNAQTETSVLLQLGFCWQYSNWHWSGVQESSLAKTSNDPKTRILKSHPPNRFYFPIGIKFWMTSYWQKYVGTLDHSRTLSPDWTRLQTPFFKSIKMVWSMPSSVEKWRSSSPSQRATERHAHLQTHLKDAAVTTRSLHLNLETQNIYKKSKQESIGIPAPIAW